ncbi:unnamed protein product [Cylicocyclus nassatus]|uniref:Uncharacterized protein n=1 Tax=Cylicocyclus nassatus TaxID=53992 RepID=A0AA36M8I2_CYLNA|nr:unnamed protein product [Cylicocyclus nassatus]
MFLRLLLHASIKANDDKHIAVYVRSSPNIEDLPTMDPKISLIGTEVFTISYSVWPRKRLSMTMTSYSYQNVLKFGARRLCGGIHMFTKCPTNAPTFCLSMKICSQHR